MLMYEVKRGNLFDLKEKSQELKRKKRLKKERKELLRECEREIFEKESSGETWGYIVDAWV